MDIVCIFQGVSFAVFLHESRALTEQKEKTAKPYVPSADEIQNTGK